MSKKTTIKTMQVRHIPIRYECGFRSTLPTSRNRNDKLTRRHNGSSWLKNVKLTLPGFVDLLRKGEKGVFFFYIPSLSPYNPKAADENV